SVRGASRSSSVGPTCVSVLVVSPPTSRLVLGKPLPVVVRLRLHALRASDFARATTRLDTARVHRTFATCDLSPIHQEVNGIRAALSRAAVSPLQRSALHHFTPVTSLLPTSPV